MRALKALGYNPAVTHINEGHSAFLLFERIRMHMGRKGFYVSGSQRTGKSIVRFYDPYPGAAGNEVFVPDLIEKYIMPI